jgi:tetraprenyl-beta-curcumene synthase
MPRFTGENHVAFATSFAGAARRYWLHVFPHVCREVGYWRARACEISDPTLRRLALNTHEAKRTNLEGAAAFAAFASRDRVLAVRALTTYQMIFDYLDVLAEQPTSDPVRNGLQLNAALHAALLPGEGHRDYYAHHSHRDDGGYLVELIDTCRAALRELPSFAAIATAARRANDRIVSYQSFNHGDADGSHTSFNRWARRETEVGSGLRWWETAAAAGSSLAVLALIAAATDPALRAETASAIEGVYFPWIGALHSLLDSFIDRVEDLSSGERGLIDYYASPTEAASRMALLSAESLRAARALPQGRQQHTLMLAGMTSHYLSMPEAALPEALPTVREVLLSIGGIAIAPMLVMLIRRAAGRVVREHRLRVPRVGRATAVGAAGVALAGLGELSVTPVRGLGLHPSR